jgi:O-antigen/teichoic acid export membrane protein
MSGTFGAESSNGSGVTNIVARMLTKIRARQGGFLHSVGVLVSGSVFAHAITALALLILTRLYSPADFSVLAVYTSLLTIISVVACLRFEVAIPLAERDDEAANILALALGCVVIVTAAIALCVLLLPAPLIAWSDQPGITPYLWLVPAGVLLAGFHGALQFWFVRRRQFGLIARTRIAQAGVAGTAQVGFGFAGFGAFGLLFGQMLNNGAACFALAYGLIRDERALARTVSWQRMKASFRDYSRFPKYSTFEALGSTAGMYAPILIIAAMAEVSEAGYVNLAMYVIQAPVSLLGGAISQVYLSRASDEYRLGRLGSFTSEVFGGLCKVGLGPLLLGGILAPDLFAIIFGETWRRAGVLVAWMTPWFALQFLVVPISMALHVTSRQRTALVLQFAGLILRVAFVYGASLWASNRISEAYAVSGLVLYGAYLAVVLNIVGSRARDVLDQFRRSLPIIAAWGGAAVVIWLGLRAVLPVLQ